MALNFQQHEPASTGRLSLIIALAVSLVCVGLYQAEGATGPLHSLQSAVEGAMVPLQRASAPLTEAVDDAGAAAAEGGVTEETYATLRQQNEQLVQQLAAAEEQRLENERLRGLLNLRDTYEITGVSGRVIGRTTDAWNQTVTLDVGSSSGVETGLTVLGPTGVVGQVISVDGGSCRVRLLTDPQSGAAAMVQSSRAEGIVRGSLEGLLYLENVDEANWPVVGDVIVTSGLGGSYVRGLIIGTVVKVDAQQGDTSRRIVVSPNDSIDTLEDVLVVSSVGVSDDDDSDSTASSSSTSTSGSNSSSGSNTGSSSSSSSSSSNSDNSGNGNSSTEGGR